MTPFGDLGSFLISPRMSQSVWSQLNSLLCCIGGQCWISQRKATERGRCPRHYYTAPSEAVTQFPGELTCEVPNKHIYEFASSLRMHGMCNVLLATWGFVDGFFLEEIRWVGVHLGKCPRGFY